MNLPSGLDTAQELIVLSYAIRLLLAQSDGQRLVACGMESLADFSQSERLGLFFLSPSGEELTVAGCLGAEAPAGALRLAVAGTPFADVIASKQPRQFALTDFHGLPCPTSGTGFVERQCLCVPLIEAHNRVIGVVTCDQPADTALSATTMQCLVILQSVLAVSLENTRMWDELQQAHAELETHYHAKSKMIDHLSHELKTPLAILSASARLLRKASMRQSATRFDATLDRMQRNIARLLELEEEAQDIAQRRAFEEKIVLESMIRQCQDLLETLVDEHDPPPALSADLARRLEELYLPPGDCEERPIFLQQWVPEVLAGLESLHRHRRIRLELELAEAPAVRLPEAPLYKAFSGLVRNAIEYTPDGGTIRVELHWHDGTLSLRVRDFGVGMDDEFQRLLFHGFMHAGDTQEYSSGRPYDFQAGGKGLDLLRTRVFSERYGFRLQVESQYGKGSLFSLVFPAAMLTTQPDSG
jgi:signal transduction histidine kinase